MTYPGIARRSSVRASALLLCALALSPLAGSRLVAAEPAAPTREPDTRPAHGHCAHHAPVAAAEPLPGASLYNLRARLVDQHNNELGFDAFAGHPVIVTMFYASCTTVCPLLIEQVKSIDAALAPEIRAQTRILALTLDPEHDDVARLAALAASHGVRDQRWHFARGSDSTVRELAALLGVRYRRLPDGSIAHSPVIALLDAHGVLLTRIDGGAPDVAAFASAVARSVASRR